MENKVNKVLEKRRSTVRFSPDVKAALRRMAAEKTNETGENVTMDQLVNTAIRYWLDHQSPVELADHRAVESFRAFLQIAEPSSLRQVLQAIAAQLELAQHGETGQRRKAV